MKKVNSCLTLKHIPWSFHLSWSALETLEKGDKYWVDKYINGKETYETKYLKLGKKFSEAMQDGFCDDEHIEFVASITPRLDRIEEEIRADYEGVELLGYKDSSSDSDTYEYKTAIKITSKGEPSWTQKRASEHGQLAFYALIDVLNGKEIPRFKLYWLPTELKGQEVVLTGEIIEFTVEVTMSQVNAMKERVKNALLRIDNLFKLYGEQRT